MPHGNLLNGKGLLGLELRGDHLLPSGVPWTQNHVRLILKIMKSCMFFHCFRSVVATSILLIVGLPSHAVVRLVVRQVGPDVVVTGSGSANTAGLIYPPESDTQFTNVFRDSQIYAGFAAFSDGHVNRWSGLTGPATFGSNPDVTENPDPATSTGQLFGIFAQADHLSKLVLPAGYSSGDSLSGTSTFTSMTLAQLGLTPGQVETWTWGSGSTADRLQLEVLESVPAPVPLLVAAAAFSRLSRLRRLSQRLPS